MRGFRSPRAIAADDPTASFECGERVLDDWLRGRALKNEQTGASRTFVSIDSETGLVAGFYCLAASSLALEDAAGRVRRNMPSPVPVILIGRLAVDARFVGRGLGASLLQDAVLKSVEASRILGARAIVVTAISDSAARFYERLGFASLPTSSGQYLYLLIADAEATVRSLA